MQIEPLYALLALYMRSIWELWDAQQATRALQDAARMLQDAPQTP